MNIKTSNKPVINFTILIVLIIAAFALSKTDIEGVTKTYTGLLLGLVVIVYIIKTFIYDNSYCNTNLALCKKPVASAFVAKKLDDYYGKSPEELKTTIRCDAIEINKLKEKPTQIQLYVLIITLIMLAVIVIFSSSKDTKDTKDTTWAIPLILGLAGVVISSMIYYYKNYVVALNIFYISIALVIALTGFKEENKNYVWPVIVPIIMVFTVYKYYDEIAAGHLSKYTLIMSIWITGIAIFGVILYLINVIFDSNSELYEQPVTYIILAGYILAFLYMVKLYNQCLLYNYYCTPSININTTPDKKSADINIACEAKYI